MKTTLNLLTMGVTTALIVAGIGFIARGYYLLFMLGWGVL